MNSKDKLQFDKIELTNGHFLYTQSSDLPVTYIRISIPLGSVHAHHENIHLENGYVHFLEHMCFEPSKQYPDKVEYMNLLSETGSSQNAWTDAFYTVYNFEAPSETFQKSFPAFLNHILEPLFNEADIQLQKNIITNERTQRKFFPGDDELSQYEHTKWMSSIYYPKNQIFGSDTNLADITPKKLQTLHKLYFNSPIDIFVSGSFDVSAIIQELEKIPKAQNEVELKPILHSPVWNTAKYHTFSSGDVDTLTYYIGNIFNGHTHEDQLSVDFILQMLTHEEFGTLNNWIRKEKGWSYGIEPNYECEKDRIIWKLKIPLNSLEAVEVIRNEIHQRILQTIEDVDFINSTKRRLLLALNFDFETISSRLDHAVTTQNLLGHIPTEEMNKDWLINKVNPGYIKTMYQKHFAPEKLGEFLAVPKST